MGKEKKARALQTDLDPYFRHYVPQGLRNPALFPGVRCASLSVIEYGSKKRPTITFVRLVVRQIFPP